MEQNNPWLVRYKDPAISLRENSAQALKGCQKDEFLTSLFPFLNMQDVSLACGGYKNLFLGARLPGWSGGPFGGNVRPGE
eukprot:318395-Pelagomonas_calceolata.AAC.15